MQSKFVARTMVVAVGMALVQMAYAQEAKDPQATGGLNLERIVVTGSATGGSKMKQSLSISTVDADQMLQAQPSNAADVLRAIPGIHSESSGGGGNANVTVRGLPISAGGSRYVQFQENGLPVLLFGDMSFATPDSFIRADSSIDHLEVVRGGTGSTLATNSPGGVINFITKTGEEKGGSVGYSRGLNYDDSRFDFNYGGQLNASTRAFISGSINTPSEGARNAASSSTKGNQIRGNVTHDFDGGFIRVNFKHIDDQQPLYMPVPVTITNGTISAIPGIDPRKASFYSPYWVADNTLNKGNTLTASDVNSGLTIKSDSVGFESKFKLGGGWTAEDKFQTARNSGRFISIFPGDNVATAAVGSSYATGPNAGKAYAGNVFTATVFNTSLDKLDNTANDFKASKVFNLDGNSKITTTAGLFYDVQNVGLTWNFNQYLLQATDTNPALIRNTTTNSSGLIAQGTDVWGGCCSRLIDAKYVTTSPYFALAWEQGPWNIDGSVRHDSQTATGSFTPAVNQQYKAANAVPIDYTKAHTSYSVGGNYRLDANLALFARVSNGVAFNADRIMFNGPLTSSGVVPINEVDQYEGGVKWRSGSFSSFVTLFQAKTKETNYDATTQVSSANTYNAKGVEVEAGYKMGSFNISGGMTLTDAEVKASNNAAYVGKTPNRLAKVIYQITPSYTVDKLTVGASIVGTSASKDSQTTSQEATLPAYTLVNVFGNYTVYKDVTASLGVSNLFNTLAFTESNDGRMAARAVNGRLVKLEVKYAF